MDLAAGGLQSCHPHQLLPGAASCNVLHSVSVSVPGRKPLYGQNLHYYKLLCHIRGAALCCSHFPQGASPTQIFSVSDCFGTDSIWGNSLIPDRHTDKPLCLWIWSHESHIQEQCTVLGRLVHVHCAVGSAVVYLCHIQSNMAKHQSKSSYALKHRIIWAQKATQA